MVENADAGQNTEENFNIFHHLNMMSHQELLNSDIPDELIYHAEDYAYQMAVESNETPQSVPNAQYHDLQNVNNNDADNFDFDNFEEKLQEEVQAEAEVDERFRKVTDKDVDYTAGQSNRLNTQYQTKWAVKVFTGSTAFH